MPSLWVVYSGIFDDYDWIELPPRAQVAAAALGYDQNTWDNDIPICTFWSKMTPAEQDAVVELGENAESWNTAVFEGCVDEGWYDEVLWSELPWEIKSAAALLAYNQSLWDSGSETFITEKDWSALTQEQQDAAWELGWGDSDWYLY